MEKNNKSVIVIIGSGFGGLQAATKLRKADAHVLLLDKRNYHLFQPLLYQVATAGLSPTDIAHPVRVILRDQRNLEFRMEEVTGVDFANNLLSTKRGEVNYDYLILAVGSQTSYFGLDSVEKNAFVLKDLDDANAIRNHLLAMFEHASEEPDPEKRKALLTFVIGGGGPTGVESSGALSELIRLALLKDYTCLSSDEINVILLEATQELLPGFPEELRKYAEEKLRRKHVDVRLGTAVTGYDGKQVTLKNGEAITTCTMIWAAGARAEVLVDSLDVPKGRNNRLVVQPTLQIEGYPNVFVIGDAAYLEDNGHSLPMMAPVAIQQGKLAADNILRMMDGKPLEKFQYHDPGSLATIGRNAAVARIKNLKFSGFLAWVVWLVVHIYWLIGFRNRLLVLFNWAWNYIFYEAAVLIIEPEKQTGPEEEEKMTI